MNNIYLKEENKNKKIIGGKILKNTISLLLAINISLSSFFNIPIFEKLFPKKDNDNKYNIEILLDDTNQNYDIPDISKKVDNLPWKNDKEFLKSKDKYNTPYLISGYCAVLNNPLPGESYNVNLASKMIKGKIIKPDKVFSQNKLLGPYSEEQGFKKGASYIGGNIVMTTGGGVCKITSTLYNLAVFSNLKIIERHNHSMPINYIPYGQDATVAYGVKDLKFKNTSKSNILIWSKLIDNRLYIVFYGNYRPPEITWNHEIKNIKPPSTKYTKNADLKEGEMNILIKGLNGALVKSSIIIKDKNGAISHREMGTSKYTPLPELIEIN